MSVPDIRRYLLQPKVEPQTALFFGLHTQTLIRLLHDAPTDMDFSQRLCADFDGTQYFTLGLITERAPGYNLLIRHNTNSQHNPVYHKSDPYDAYFIIGEKESCGYMHLSVCTDTISSANQFTFDSMSASDLIANVERVRDVLQDYLTKNIGQYNIWPSNNP
jgi:hypothetical protein